MGAILSNWLLGKYRTIIALSVVYCLGHLALALDDTRLGLSIGLSLIAFGSGAIKPCMSAPMGDQFGTRIAHMMSNMFSWHRFVWAWRAVGVSPLFRLFRSRSLLHNHFADSA